MSDQELLSSIWDHIESLRSTLIRIIAILFSGMVVALYFYQSIFLVLTANLNKELLLFGPLDGLVLTLKVCFWTSLAVTSPLWGWTVMQFIVPGLRREEKNLAIPFLTGSFLSVCLGITFAYKVTLPFSNTYLADFNETIGINAWSLERYMDYTLLLFTGHAAALELWLILFFLVHMGWISPESLANKRRYMVLLSFILGAFLTPPDVASQILLAVPLYILFEFAIIYGKYIKRFRFYGRK